MKGALFNLMRGKIGDTVAYVRNGKQFYRVRLRHFKNPRTCRQMIQRVKMYNLCAMYRAMSGLLRESFETRKPNQSGYNAFMSMNLGRVNCYLGKEFRDNNACVAQPYMISCGTIPTVTTEKDGNGFRSCLSVGDLLIDERTTVAEFSRALIDNNEGYVRNGDQLTYVSVVQDVAMERFKSWVSVNYYVVHVNTNDSTPLRNWLPEFASTVHDGYLGTSDKVPQGGFCYMLSRVGRDGVLHVSTQVLVDAGMWNFSSEKCMLEAVRSYNAKVMTMVDVQSIIDEKHNALAFRGFGEKCRMTGGTARGFSGQDNPFRTDAAPLGRRHHKVLQSSVFHQLE